jgi:hypothetical protein
MKSVLTIVHVRHTFIAVVGRANGSLTSAPLVSMRERGPAALDLSQWQAIAAHGMGEKLSTPLAYRSTLEPRPRINSQREYPLYWVNSKRV